MAVFHNHQHSPTDFHSLPQTMTILIMLFSSVVFGAKLAGLGTYKTVRVHRDAMEARFMHVFDVVFDPSDPDGVILICW